MKRITTIILTLCCLLMPLAVIGDAPRSPTIDALWYAEPTLQFQLLNDMDEFAEYLELISTYYDLEGFTEMALGTDEFHIIDMIIVTLDQTYGRVVWHTPYGFTTTDNICVFMISTNLWQGYVMNANGDRNDNLVVNYSEVSPGTYFMIIYAAD